MPYSPTHDPMADSHSPTHDPHIISIPYGFFAGVFYRPLELPPASKRGAASPQSERQQEPCATAISKTSKSSISIKSHGVHAG